MQKLIDKSVLFGLCLLALSQTRFEIAALAALLAAVAVSSLCGYFENRVNAYLCAGYVVLCMIMPESAIFLPLIAYDCAGLKKIYSRFCWVAALPFCFAAQNLLIFASVTVSSLAALLLQYRTEAQIRARGEYFILMDSAKERAERLEQKNHELTENLGYEIRLATLSERNRIAREIHDNVGHLLTRSILQLGALRVTHAKDAKLAEEIDLVKDTLSGAMDTVRSSVHNLHDESADLKMQLQAMIDAFRFCPVKLRYDAGELPGDIRVCFASIVREALSNIAKHSNAREAVVSLIEHPAFCQLVIEDNGTVRAVRDKRGIGLQIMEERVGALGGIFHVENTKGFKIFISVPKESVRGV